MPADGKCRGLFITGTDTGVGKTVIAAAIARHFSRSGIKVGIMKPCETGVDDVQQPGEDARLLRWAAGSGDADDLIAPYRFKEPLAPSLAAEREGIIIDPVRIGEALTTVSAGKDLVLVEGAGGLMVPLRGGYLIADLARQLGLPLLVVSRASLGTINHTLLTIMAARSMELPLAGFVINRMPAHPGAAEEAVPHLLAALASADLLGVFPEVAGTPENRIDQLADVLGNSPALPWLLRAIGLPPTRNTP